MDQPLFTVYLEERGDVDNVPGGYITYGGLDTQNCGAVIAYQPLSSATFFQFTINEVSLGVSGLNGYRVSKKSRFLSFVIKNFQNFFSKMSHKRYFNARNQLRDREILKTLFRPCNGVPTRED